MVFQGGKDFGECSSKKLYIKIVFTQIKDPIDLPPKQVPENLLFIGFWAVDIFLLNLFANLRWRSRGLSNSGPWFQNLRWRGLGWYLLGEFKDPVENLKYCLLSEGRVARRTLVCVPRDLENINYHPWRWTCQVPVLSLKRPPNSLTGFDSKRGKHIFIGSLERGLYSLLSILILFAQIFLHSHVVFPKAFCILIQKCYFWYLNGL